METPHNRNESDILMKLLVGIVKLAWNALCIFGAIVLLALIYGLAFPL